MPSADELIEFPIMKGDASGPKCGSAYLTPEAIELLLAGGQVGIAFRVRRNKKPQVRDLFSIFGQGEEKPELMSLSIVAGPRSAEDTA